MYALVCVNGWLHAARARTGLVRASHVQRPVAHCQSPRVHDEAQRMLAFRDHLRAHPDDRARYATEKRRLAAQKWTYIQDYADAKTAVVQEILAHLDA